MQRFGFVNTQVMPIRSDPERLKLMIENPQLLMDTERRLRLMDNVIHRKLQVIEDLKRASQLLTMSYSA